MNNKPNHNKRKGKGRREEDADDNDEERDKRNTKHRTINQTTLKEFVYKSLS